MIFYYANYLMNDSGGPEGVGGGGGGVEVEGYPMVHSGQTSEICKS